MPGILSQADVPFLPVVAAFVKKIGVAEVVDRLCAKENDVRSDFVVSTVNLDTLSGRSPLYRFERFFSYLDTELLPGETMPVGFRQVFLCLRGQTSSGQWHSKAADR